MTMVARGDDGVVRTEPLMNPIEPNGGDYAPVPVTAEGVEFDWNKWLNSWLDNERSVMIPWYAKQLREFGDELLDLIKPQLEKIKALELQLAEARGALDVLRGRGVPGVPNVKGTFDSNATYLYLDIVALNGSSFIAIKDSPGRCPGDGWQLLASAGRRGPRGDRGPVGRGADAPVWSGVSFDSKRLSFTACMSDGSSGPTVSLDSIFASVAVDPRTYSIKFAMNDGSELKFSLRALFAQFFDEVKGR
jgi:hypothetical protein